MTVRARWTLPLVGLALAGCVGLPARFCLTPVYDAPAGFSETYHAALRRQEPVLQPGDAPIPPGPVGGFPINPGWASLVPASTSGEPPIDW